MTGPSSGFSAIVGNPPWEIQKPNSMEFFSNEDPLYRSYSKQEALRKQVVLFREREGVEDRWIRYVAMFKSLSNWTKHAGFPFGTVGVRGESLGGVEAVLLRVWQERRERRATFSDPAHPFRYQGSADINTYKMFLEFAHVLLREDGELALVVQASFYGDAGPTLLRKLLIHEQTLSYLYGFQNEKGVFESVHHAKKMCVPFVKKAQSGESAATRLTFSIGIAGSPGPSELDEQIASASPSVQIRKATLQQLSPFSGTILELREQAEVDIIQKLLRNSKLLGANLTEGWQLSYANEFHLTTESALFPPRPEWEAKGYKQDEYGHWTAGTREPVALPVYEGRSIGQFDFQRKTWVSGRGRRARWKTLSWDEKVFGPQYLMSRDDYERGAPATYRKWKVAFMDVAASNVTRTMIAALIHGMPCGNSAPVLTSNSECVSTLLILMSILNSFAYDFFARRKCTGNHLNWFVIEETPLPLLERTIGRGIERFAARLIGAHLRYAPMFAELKRDDPWLAARPWRSLWAIRDAERTRLRTILDALVADVYGLAEEDLRYILRDVDHPIDSLAGALAGTIDSKAFWLVDKDRSPEHRQSVLALVAFRELKKIGLEKFLALNEGDGWHLPDTIRLADYDLGHDARAREHQPVAAALGERFLPWQLGEDVEASWEECRRHAELIGRIISPTQMDAAGVPVPRLIAEGRPTQGGLFEGLPALNLVIQKTKGRKR